MQELHRVLVDGSVEHVPFSRTAWEEGLANPLVRSQWTHQPGNCADPAFDAILAARREQLVQSSQDRPAPPEPLDWPPQGLPLQPWMLSQMTTLGTDDARTVLSGPRKQEEVERKPVADKRGQFSLF